MTQLGFLVRLERKLLAIIASHAVAIGAFSFTIQPIVIFTLTIVESSLNNPLCA